MFPPGRYGRRREPRRRRPWVNWTVGVLVVAIMGLITLKLYDQYGRDEFSPTVLQYTNVTDTSITVKFQVDKSSGRAAVCTLDAYAVDGSIIGTAQVPVPTGTEVTVTYTLPTTGKARTADVATCQPAG